METFTELDKNIDAHIKNEQSKSVKICLLSMKCFLIIIVATFLFIHSLYYFINNLLKDDDTKKYFEDIIEMYINQNKTL